MIFLLNVVLACLTAGLALLSATGSAIEPPGRISDSLIQIGIIQRANRLFLRPEGTFSITDQKTGKSHMLEDSVEYALTSEAGRGLVFGPYQFQGQVRLAPQYPKDFIRVQKKKYRGNLVVRPNADSTLTVIEELGLEEYLYGVLPSEMSPDWPLEALKAQAVVARTFALGNLGKYRASGFDLSDDSDSQVYADLDTHSASAIEAVEKTNNQVLYWKDRLLPAFFHSTCGGHTSSRGAIWGEAATTERPLRGVSDRYCAGSPHYEWTIYIAELDIIGALQRHKLPVAKLKDIRMGARDGSGFLKTLKLSVAGSTLQIKANDFRKWMGNTDFKSTKILKIVKRRVGYQFTGRGFGHGVGLCQYGAKGMAERGKNYQQILKYYFPGADLVRRLD